MPFILGVWRYRVLHFRSAHVSRSAALAALRKADEQFGRGDDGIACLLDTKTKKVLKPQGRRNAKWVNATSDELRLQLHTH